MASFFIDEVLELLDPYQSSNGAGLFLEPFDLGG